ncbi:hypothetical protein RCZ04_22060 [Capnocytophaga sp. HP1101]
MDNEMLIENNLFIKKRVPISTITSIAYDYIVERGAMRYFYFVKCREGKEVRLPFMTCEGKTYQQLFKDILRINPHIVLDDNIKNFLNETIPDLKLHFNFRHIHKNDKEFDRCFRQNYPSILVFFVLSLILAFGVFSSLTLLGMEFLFSEVLHKEAGVFQGIFLVLSIAAMLCVYYNLMCALISQYIGHKFTFISLAVAVISLILLIIV